RKIAELDEFGLQRVVLGEQLQGLVEGHQVVRRLLDHFRRPVQIDLAPGTAAFGTMFLAGVVHQDTSHGFRGGPKEMGAAGPLPGAFRVHQAQVGLMDQGGGVEGLSWLLVRQLLDGQLAQFVVDQRQELGGVGRVALRERRQDAGDIVHERRAYTTATFLANRSRWENPKPAARQPSSRRRDGEASANPRRVAGPAEHPGPEAGAAYFPGGVRTSLRAFTVTVPL